MAEQAVAKPKGIGPKSIKTRVISLAIGIAFLIVCYFAPCPEGLTQGGKMALALLITGLIVWIFESTPQCISAMFLMILMSYLDVMKLSDIWPKFATSAWFFVMSTFVFTAALEKTTIPTRLVAWMLKISKGKPKGVVLTFLLAPFLLSCFCTNIASTAMFMGIVVGMLQSAKCVPGESRLGRCLMMAVPYGAFIGGCTLLCGSSANVTVLALAEAAFTAAGEIMPQGGGVPGFDINFGVWAACGIPLAIITLPITWIALCVIFKPEGVDPEAIEEVQQQVKEMGPWSALDKKVGIIILLCLALWVASTWTKMNTAVIGIFGMFLMFLPGIDAINYKEFANGVSWNVMLIMGSIIALGAGLTATGANKWLADLLMPLIAGAGPTGGMAISSYALVLIRCLLPTASAMAAVTVAPLGTIAVSLGMSLTAMCLACAWMSGTTFLLPVDNLLLIPYSFGWSSMTETLRAGWVPAIVIATYAWTIAPLILGIFGL